MPRLWSACAELVTDGDTGGDAALDLAVSLRGQGEMEEAIAILHQALARSDGAIPGDTPAASTAPGAPTAARQQEIRLLLASLYVDMGRVAEGKEVLAPMLQSGQGNPETYATLERLSTQGLRAKMEQLRTASARNRTNVRARLEFARVTSGARLRRRPGSAQLPRRRGGDGSDAPL